MNVRNRRPGKAERRVSSGEEPSGIGVMDRKRLELRPSMDQWPTLLSPARPRLAAKLLVATAMLLLLAGEPLLARASGLRLGLHPADERLPALLGLGLTLLGLEALAEFDAGDVAVGAPAPAVLATDLDATRTVKKSDTRRHLVHMLATGAARTNELFLEVTLLHPEAFHTLG